MDNKEYRYEIGDKVFMQKPLVLGQIKQLASVLDKMNVDITIDEKGIAKLFLDNAAPGLAVVLTEEGKSPRDKDLNALADELEFTIDADTLSKVIEDFFACNPIASIFGKMSKMTEAIREKMKTGSKKPASSSGQETLQSEKPSSGDIHQESAPPGSNIGQET